MDRSRYDCPNLKRILSDAKVEKILHFARFDVAMVEKYLGVTMAQLPQGSPVPGQVWAPTQPGLYAVVVLQHGFLLSNTYYSQLIAQIASHGFIVVAPQMYEAGGLPFGKGSTMGFL